MAMGATASGLVYIDRESVLDQTSNRFDMQKKMEDIFKAESIKVKLEDNYLRKTANAEGGLVNLIRVSIQGLSGELRNRLSKENILWKDRVYNNKDYDVITEGLSYHIKEYDYSFTINNVIDQVKKGLDIKPSVDLRFWSPAHGIISEGVIIDSNVPNGELKIDENTLYDDISDIEGLTLIHDVSSLEMFKDPKGYKTLRTRFSYILGGDYRVDEFCGTYDEAKTLDSLYNFIKEVNYEYTMQSTGIDNIYNIRTVSHFSIKSRYDTFHRQLFLNSKIEDIIKSPDWTQEDSIRWGNWIITTNMVREQIVYSAITSTAPNRLKNYITERSEMAILAQFMKEKLGNTVKGSVIQNIDTFLNDKNAKEEFRDLILRKSFISEFWMTFLEGIFDDARSSSLSIVKNPFTYIGRIGETQDFGTGFDQSKGFIYRLLNNFIANDYKPPIAVVDGVNFGLGRPMKGNDYIEELLENNQVLGSLHDIKGSILGLDIRSITNTLTSFARICDENSLFVWDNFYDTQEVKATGNTEGISTNQIIQLKNDVDSSQMMSVIFELARGVTQLKDLKTYKYRAVGSLPSDVDPSVVLSTLIMFSAISHHFRDYGVAGSHKMISDLSYIFGMIDEVNQLLEDKLASSDKNKVIADVLEYLRNPENFASFKESFEEQLEDILSDERAGSLGLDSIESTIEWLELNIENLVQKDDDAEGHKLALEEHKDLLFLDKDNKPLEFKDLPPAFTFILINDRLVPTRLTEDLFNEFKAQRVPLLVAHKNPEVNPSYSALPTFGVIPAEINNLLPKGFDQGLLTDNGEAIANIYLSNPDFIRLESRVKVEDGKVTIRPEGWQVEFIQVDKDTRSGAYYSAFSVSTSLVSGTYCFCTLQKVEGTYDSISVIPKFLPEITRRTLGNRFKQGSELNPISLGQRSIIPLEVFFESYLNLIDIRTILKHDQRGSTRRAYANSYINDYIGLFNIKFDPDSGIYGLSTRRDKSDIEGIMNRLFENEQKVKKFLLLKDEAGRTVPMHEGDMTFKQWMHWLYDELTDEQIELNDDKVSSFIVSAQKTIKSKYKQNPFDISEGRQEKCSKEELVAARFLYEDVYSTLFGHFTLRLLFLHMIDFYGGPRSFKLDFLNVLAFEDIVRFLNQFSIMSPVQIRDFPIRDVTTIKNHLFSIIFMNSYMRLPTEKDIEISPNENKIFFGYSPMTFIDSSLSAKNERVLSLKITDVFLTKYRLYKSLHYSGNDKDRRVDLFIESGLEILPIVKNKLRNAVDNLELSTEEREYLYNKLSIAAERELLDYTGHRINYGGHRFFNVRYQIENLLIGYSGSAAESLEYNLEGNSFEDDIIFHQVVFDKDVWYKNSFLKAFEKGESFSLSFDKDDFSGRNIQIWRDLKYGGQSYRFSDVDFEQYNRGIILEKTQILRESLQDIFGKDGECRIYPLFYQGSGEGYHSLLRTNRYQSLVPTQRASVPNTNKKDARRFDIVLSDPFLQQKLEHIIKLSGSYLTPGSQTADTKDFIFIITKNINVPIYEYNKIVGAFDRNKFYSPGEILSLGEGNSDHRPVPITAFEDDMQIGQEFIDKWEKFRNKFLVVPTTSMFSTDYTPWWQI